MPRVRYTGGAMYAIRDGPTFEAGDEADVDEGTADRLTDRHDFERVDTDTTGGEDESDAGGDGSEAEANTRETDTPPFDPGEYSVDDLRDELDDHDLTTDQLVLLKAAEAEGENRTTAKDAIQSQINAEA